MLGNPIHTHTHIHTQARHNKVAGSGHLRNSRNLWRKVQCPIVTQAGEVQGSRRRGRSGATSLNNAKTQCVSLSFSLPLSRRLVTCQFQLSSSQFVERPRSKDFAPKEHVEVRIHDDDCVVNRYRVREIRIRAIFAWNIPTAPRGMELALELGLGTVWTCGLECRSHQARLIIGRTLAIGHNSDALLW